MAKTTVLIDINVGPQLPPDTAWLQWAAPIEFDSGNTYVLAVPAAVKLVEGKGQVSVDPGIWIVTSVGLGTITTRAWQVPASDAPVQFNSLVEVTDLSSLGFGPTWAARAEYAALQALQAAAEVQEALADLLEQLANTNAQVAAFIDADGPTRTSAMALIDSMIEAGVPPLIAAALIEANPAIAELAAELAQSDANLVKVQRFPGTEWERGFADNQRRLQLGFRRDGGTDIPILNSTRATLGQINGIKIEYGNPDVTGYVIVVRDSARRILGGLKKEGVWHLPLMQTGSDVAAAPPSQYKSSYQAATRKIASGPDVALAGHSMLNGAVSAISTALTGVSVSEICVGGETSRNIAARGNAQPMLFALTGGALPASGAVDVALSYADMVLPAGTPGGGGWPLLQDQTTYAGSLVIEGVSYPGTFSIIRDPAATAYTHHPGDRYQFTRTTPGAVVPAARRHPFYYDISEPLRDRIFVYWIGRNNVTETDQVIGDLQALIQRQSTLDKRFLVISEHNTATEYPGAAGASTYAAITSLNNRSRLLYGRRFVDSRRYLIDFGLAHAGIAPTTQDLADIANDVIPSSLRSDNLHLNAAGSAIIADLVKARLRELGWY